MICHLVGQVVGDLPDHRAGGGQGAEAAQGGGGLAQQLVTVHLGRLLGGLVG